MLTPLYSYYFKQERTINNLRLTDVATATEINISQLSLFENNDLMLSNRQIDKLTVFYKHKPTYFSNCSISEKYMFDCFKKLYYMNFSETDLNELIEQINRLKNNAYLGYYEIILWCYKALHIRFDDLFLNQIQLFESSLSLFPIEIQEFFHICLLHYYSRINRTEKFIEIKNILQTYSRRKWLGLDLIAEIGYCLTNNQIVNIHQKIEKCKHYFTENSNYKRYNASLMFEAIYLTKIKAYNAALDVYDNLKNIYSENKDRINYHIVLNNIASIYFYSNQYVKAIPLFIRAYDQLHHNSVLFNIVYCYYVTKEIAQAKKWIAISNDTISVNDCNSILIRWVKTMIEAPYSKTCINLLKKTLSTGFIQLETEKQLFIYQAILDYYIKTKDIENAQIFISKIAELNGDGGYKG